MSTYYCLSTLTDTKQELIAQLKQSFGEVSPCTSADTPASSDTVFCLIGTAENCSSDFINLISSLFRNKVSLIPIVCRDFVGYHGPEQLNSTLAFIWSREHIISQSEYSQNGSNDYLRALATQDIPKYKNRSLRRKNDNLVVHHVSIKHIIRMALWLPLMIFFIFILSLLIDNPISNEQPFVTLFSLALLPVAFILYFLPYQSSKSQYYRYGSTKANLIPGLFLVAVIICHVIILFKHVYWLLTF